MARRYMLLCSLACAACVVLAPSASARPTFKPRIANALGLVPPNNMRASQIAPVLAIAAHNPLTYHGAQVMAHGVTVHTIFWGPKGSFNRSPRHGVLGYEALIEQFFTDIARDSGKNSNVYSTLIQYAEGTRPGAITPGKYAISYSKSKDNLIDTHPYPSKQGRCTSPRKSIHTCVTDTAVQHEINRVIERTHGKRGLTQLWFIFTPPKVDECISKNSCGTNAFLGYHSVSDLGHGAVIYAIAIDPLIEGAVPKHQDPEGNPEAEDTIDTAAHETEEAITDPEGVGYMDPNGFEVADKCERPVLGKPLGHAPDGAPYNQLVNHHEYLFQEMWSNDNGGCVQRTTATRNPLPLPQVNLTQFSSRVTGNIERRKGGVHVKVSLLRSSATHKPVAVAGASTTTKADGSWSLSLARHAVGDDRDEIIVQYSGSGAPAPHRQSILTGNGGNPFTESGWTGWLDMDNGSHAGQHPSLKFGPCFQTGVEHYAIGGKTAAGSPTKFCSTKTGVATVHLSSPLKASQAVTWSSNDNRAFAPVGGGPAPNANGGLVNLTVNVGEPGSVSLFSNPKVLSHFFEQSGFPTCTAFLSRDRVSCAGLVPGASYRLSDGAKHASAKANAKGIAAGHLAIKGGDVIALSNGSRVLTRLHVAHLHVVVKGNRNTASGGSCQAGEYYGPAPAKAPTNNNHAGSLTGGIALTGEICPLSGKARGLPIAHVEQTDELSGGMTVQ